jgi:hypothetical protein
MDDDIDDTDSESDESESDERADDESITFHAENPVIAQEAADGARDLEANMVNFIDVDEIKAGASIPEGGVDNPREIDALLGEGIAELREINAQMHQLITAAQARPAAEQATGKWSAIACGILGGVTAILSTIYAIKTYYDSQNKQPPPFAAAGGDLGEDPGVLPAQLLPSTQKVVAALDALSDAQYWERFAAYVDKYRPCHWDEQLLFSQHTADIFQYRVKPIWQWQSATDKLSLVTSLVDTIRNDGLAAAYRSLHGLTAAGKAVPRAVAANLVSLAICQWYATRR